MNRWWLSFAILVAIAEDAAETSHEQTTHVPDVVIAETSSAVPHDGRQTVVETSTFPVAVETSYGTTTTTTTTNAQETGTVDELRKRVAQQTDELSKAIAALSIAQHYEQRMADMEREKYKQMKTVENKLSCLVDNTLYEKRGTSNGTDNVRRGLSSTYRTSDQSGRRLQVIRRLLTEAEVGLAKMQSFQRLNASKTDRRKK